MERFIAKKIEQVRKRLNKLIELHGTQSPKVLKCSQELDRLIFNAYSNKKGVNS